jgi:DNA-binding response OmpR family regulator
LVANLDAIIRRTHGHSSATVNVGNLMVDLSRNYAKIGDAGASGVVIDTIWGQGYILREMRDYDAMTVSA